MKQHPCFSWCGETLKGIVENINLTSDESFVCEVKSVRFPRKLSGDKVGLTCRHGRHYLVERVTRS